MAQTYFFNIGILPVDNENEQITEESKINFVLNILNRPLQNKAIDALPYDEKISQLHQCINYYIEIYNDNQGQSTDEDNFSFNKQNNNDKESVENIEQSEKYKLGIVCDGFYNNQLLLVTNTKQNIMIEVNKDKVNTLIVQLLCSLGYNVKCMAMIYENKSSFEDAFFKDEIIFNTKAIPTLSDSIKAEITNSSGNYPTLNSIKNAVKYYYYTDIKTTVTSSYKDSLTEKFNEIFQSFELNSAKYKDLDAKNYKLTVNKLCSIKKLLFTIATRGNKNIYILSVPCLKDIKTDIDKPTFLIIVDYFEKHIPEYIQIVNWLSVTTDDFVLYSRSSSGGSKKRIPKRKYKYTRKLYK